MTLIKDIYQKCLRHLHMRVLQVWSYMLIFTMYVTQVDPEPIEAPLEVGGAGNIIVYAGAAKLLFKYIPNPTVYTLLQLDYDGDGMERARMLAVTPDIYFGYALGGKETYLIRHMVSVPKWLDK